MSTTTDIKFVDKKNKFIFSGKRITLNLKGRGHSYAISAAAGDIPVSGCYIAAGAQDF